MSIDSYKSCKPLRTSNTCSVPSYLKNDHGFTLIEVLVSLILGTLIVGGVMGVISVSLQFMQRLDKKSIVQPVLEAAAQEIILHPEKAKEGVLTLDELPDKPSVELGLVNVQGPDGYDISNRGGDLYRVRIGYERNSIEFSLIIPPSDLQ